MGKAKSSLLTVEPFTAHFWTLGIVLAPSYPARRLGIPQPKYRQYVLIWSCCQYRGVEWVQLSKKPHYYAHLAIINLWAAIILADQVCQLVSSKLCGPIGVPLTLSANQWECVYTILRRWWVPGMSSFHWRKQKTSLISTRSPRSENNFYLVNTKY